MSQTPSSPGRPAALVTGAAVRIGRAISLSLARRGFDLAIHYHASEPAALELAKQIEDLGARCSLFGADLTNETELLGLIGAVTQTFDKLNLLVNNAALFQPAPLTQTDPQLFHAHFALNFNAPFFLSRDFANTVAQGHIINILDSRITRHRSRYLAYTLSKKALAEFTRMTATELAPRIRVNALAPGYILPPENTLHDAQQLLKKIPLKKQGSIDHLTTAMGHLIENDYLTGQIIFADGGQNL